MEDIGKQELQCPRLGLLHLSSAATSSNNCTTSKWPFWDVGKIAAGYPIHAYCRLAPLPNGYTSLQFGPCGFWRTSTRVYFAHTILFIYLKQLCMSFFVTKSTKVQDDQMQTSPWTHVIRSLRWRAVANTLKFEPDWQGTVSGPLMNVHVPPCKDTHPHQAQWQATIAPDKAIQCLSAKQVFSAYQ